MGRPDSVEVSLGGTSVSAICHTASLYKAVKSLNHQAKKQKQTTPPALNLCFYVYQTLVLAFQSVKEQDTCVAADWNALRRIS